MSVKRMCSQCGREVATDNNALLLELEAEKILQYGYDFLEEQVEKWIEFGLQYYLPRHLLPESEGGAVVCHGLLDRAQYVVEGHSRSQDYDSELERLYRAAYQRMLARVAVTTKSGN